MPKELPPLTELEEAILERQLRERLGQTEDFWRETLLNRPMEPGAVPTPLALPSMDPTRPAGVDTSTQDPMYLYGLKKLAPMETKDPMPFVSPPQKEQGDLPLVSYL
jgi:hypothetical protein